MLKIDVWKARKRGRECFHFVSGSRRSMYVTSWTRLALRHEAVILDSSSGKKQKRPYMFTFWRGRFWSEKKKRKKKAKKVLLSHINVDRISVQSAQMQTLEHFIFTLSAQTASSPVLFAALKVPLTTDAVRVALLPVRLGQSLIWCFC